MSKKMTIAEMFTAMMEKYPFTEEEREFLEGRIAQATRKANGERKPTAKQLLNAAVADEVYKQMEPNRSYTVSEMLKVIPAFASIEECSASYANAIVKKLKDSGRVTRTEHKGRAYFMRIEQ